MAKIYKKKISLKIGLDSLLKTNQNGKNTVETKIKFKNLKFFNINYFKCSSTILIIFLDGLSIINLFSLKKF